MGLASRRVSRRARRAAIFVPIFRDVDPNAGNLSNPWLSPVWHGGTWSHPLGTDWQGYDVLARLLSGARTSLTIGVLVVLFAGTFGVLVGLCRATRVVASTVG